MNKNHDIIRLVQISFWLNGKHMELSIPPGMTTLELLNDKLALTGTKSSCNEGDCGACTVIIGQRQDSQVSYQTVNSCLYPAFKLHGKHLITIEGISGIDELHPVQTALLDEHGTQCGFCTPGFVMSLLGLFLKNVKPNREDIMAALEGNLCRCTGYDSILKAANLLRKRIKDDKDLLPTRLRDVEKQLKHSFCPVVYKEADNIEGFKTVNCYSPQTLNELWDNIKTCKKSENCKFIAGGTDLMVLANIQHIHYENLINLSNIKELNEIKSVLGLTIGANVTLAELQNDKQVKKECPLLITAIKQIASAQIRNSATLAGNIANASPVADGATTLLALNAYVVLVSVKGERKIKLHEFYKGYKQTEMHPDEIIKSIVIPNHFSGKYYYGFLKSAKRRAVDISGVVSAFSMEYKNSKILKAILSFGGVAPYPSLAVKTMKYLSGKTVSEINVNEAAEIAKAEFTPISDIRGQKEYRSILIQNHVIKHLKGFFETLKKAVERAK